MKIFVRVECENLGKMFSEASIFRFEILYELSPTGVEKENAEKDVWTLKNYYFLLHFEELYKNQIQL